MRSEDGHIIQECLNGDSASFGLLVDKYKAGIYALAYSRLHNFHDAEDVAQEVFLKAYKNLRKLRRWDSFVVWLRSMTINFCKNKLREQSRQPDREFIEDQENMEEASLDPPSEEEALITREKMLDSLDKGLESLPEIYQQVLTLHYLGGMSGEQISRFLGISHNTVRQRLSRARNLLREEVLAMMSANYEQQKLQANFTFRIVEAIKRIKIHPVSNTKTIPIGLSIATGIILTILGTNPSFTIPEYVGTSINSPLPSETKVLKTGEIPVDMVKIFKTPIISNQQDKGKGGEKLPDSKNTVFLAPRGAGNTWAKKADMPTARECLSTSVVNGKIYAIGGLDSNDVITKTMEEYDPVNDTWVRKADMPTARCFLSTSVVDGKIYAIGGFSKFVGNALSTVEVYNPMTDTWAKCSDMPAKRGSLSTSVVNGKIYAIGGNETPHSASLSTVDEYDPVTDTWAKKADMPTARCVLTTCVVNKEIYAIGGLPDNEVWAICKPLSTVESYNPATDTWTKKADMPTAKNTHSTSVVNGKIYVIGGTEHNVYTSKTVEIYDPVTDTWTKGTDMPMASTCLSASVVDGKIYAIGGYAMDGNLLSSVEEYTPEGWPFSILPQGKLPTRWGKEKRR